MSQCRVACGSSLHVAILCDVSPLLFPPQVFHSLQWKAFSLPLLFLSCRLEVFSSPLHHEANLSSACLKMTCLLLKAFKWSSVLADYQICCLVAKETHTRGLCSVFFFSPTLSLSPPSSSPEAHISKLSAIWCAHTAAFQLKAFCAARGAEWRGKESGREWLEERGGKMKGLPLGCQGNLMSWWHHAALKAFNRIPLLP